MEDHEPVNIAALSSGTAGHSHGSDSHSGSGTTTTTSSHHHSAHKRFGQVVAIEHDENEEKLRKPGLIRRPFLRQYWQTIPGGGRVLVRESGEHKASWNELVYDVIFVAVLSSIAHQLVDPSWHKEWKFFIMFAMLWRPWMDTNIFVNRFDAEDLVFRGFFFLNMLAVVVLGSGANSWFNQGVATNVVGGGYLFTRCLVLVQYLYCALACGGIWRGVLYQNMSTVISAVLFTVSLFVEEPARVILWIVALVIEFVFPLSGWIVFKYRPAWSYAALNLEHWIERMGLFTVLTLGEIVVAIAFDVSPDAQDGGAALFVAALGVLMTMSLSALYFDVDLTGTYGSHAMRWKGFYGFIWSQSHVFLHGGISMIGPGFALIMDAVRQQAVYDAEHADDDERSVVDLPGTEFMSRAAESSSLAPGPNEIGVGGRWLLAGSLGTVLFVTFMQRSLHNFSFMRACDRADKWWKVRSGIWVACRVILGLAVIATGFIDDEALTPLWRAVVLTGITFVLAFMELWNNQELLRAMRVLEANADGRDATQYYKKRWKKKLAAGQLPGRYGTAFLAKTGHFSGNDHDGSSKDTSNAVSENVSEQGVEAVIEDDGDIMVDMDTLKPDDAVGEEGDVYDPNDPNVLVITPRRHDHKSGEERVTIVRTPRGSTSERPAPVAEEEEEGSGDGGAADGGESTAGLVEGVGKQGE